MAWRTISSKINLEYLLTWMLKRPGIKSDIGVSQGVYYITRER
ncbi:unnamed protein product [Blumeria hordei]|uniref:Uncharacterized protein n=1 Tax=Blumeria hordei TaxID=2867405 RepID=A0A383UP46_BLUHO|nr:unnamed protein product [Blumeria hordei]